MSNYHGCREEVINLIPRYWIDIIYKIVAKAITFKKTAIVPNGIKLMFQVIFIFSDLILIEQIIAFSTPAAELEFPKILVPRLPQHTSNVNIECAGKSEWSKQQYSLHSLFFAS